MPQINRDLRELFLISFTASKNIRKSLAIWLEKRNELKAQEDLFIDSSKKTLDNEI